jgi:MFS family permease
MSTAPDDSAALVSVPKEATNSYRFSLFNALNFQITLGAPMVLYTKSLGASATTIGLVAAMAPLMTVLQLPTAYFIPKIGYKGFVLLGWSLRIILLVGLAILPLLRLFDSTTQISLVLSLLFLFNVIRGISTGAWLPWITALVPEQARGAFLRFDQFSMQCGGLLAIAISTLVLWSGAARWQFALLFTISALASQMSLEFIRKIPDLEIGEQAKSSGQPVPWIAILKYPPFAKLLLFNVVYNWVVGGLGAFVIAYLDGKAGYSAGLILAATLMSSIGAIISLPFFGLVLERTESKPILGLALILYVVTIVFWVLIAARVVRSDFWIVGFSYFLQGIAGALFSIANIRTAMATMPVVGRNHFFSLFTVFTSLSLGLAPIFWGVFLDVIGKHEFVLGVFQVNRYSSYFALLAILTVVTIFLARPLEEKKGKAIETAVRDVVILARLRLFSRFLSR